MKSEQQVNPSPQIIPRPQYMVLTTDAAPFLLQPSTRIETDETGRATARYLAEWLQQTTGLHPQVQQVQDSKDDALNVIVLTASGADPDLAPEGYELMAQGGRLLIRAPTEAGLFYGVQTMRQLFPGVMESPAAGENTLFGIPAVYIRDHPRFSWRGFMLDSSRHFQTAEFIGNVIDKMAMFKMNRFHWHLVDNNGWRLQIDRYPRLAKIGAFRDPNEEGANGFYTKEEVRGIVKFAESRHVMVIPEIEMPGHNMSAVQSYPWLCCTGVAPPVEHVGLNSFNAHGVRPYCAGKDSTFEFLEGVLDEVVDLFPAPYVHVGGDERPKGQWSKCPRCQARMKAEGLKDEHALQNWFMRRISDYLATKDRRSISWAATRSDRFNPQDMDDLGNNAVIQNWHGGTSYAARQGWDVINAGARYYYLNMPEFPGMDRPDWMKLRTLDTVYNAEPVPPDLEPRYAWHVLGPECCLWTEFITQDEVFRQIFPRILAVAESGWADKKKDLPEFKTRIDAVEPRLNALGVQYHLRPEDEKIR